MWIGRPVSGDTIAFEILGLIMGLTFLARVDTHGVPRARRLFPAGGPFLP